MVTTTAFLNSLPPARLAQADLGRFLTRALARLDRAELPALLDILATTPLSGYPDALGPVLRAFVEHCLEQGVALEDLHPGGVEAILSDPAWQARAQGAVDLRQRRLRPGELLSEEVRAAAAAAHMLQTLDGEGSALVLLAPVTITSVDGLGWSAPGGPVVVRPADEEEASALRRAWGRVEELHGWAAEPWVSALVAISSRPNLDAARCARALDRLDGDQRAAVWALLVEHVRGGELLEEHRPGPADLARAFARAGITLEDGSLAPLLAFARRAYEGCAPDPAVAEGICPCTRADLETYCGWPEVGEARRARLLALDPRVASYRLRVLASAERAARRPPLGDDEVADLRALRDGLLMPLYKRDVRLLRAVDPLALLQASIERGEDRDQILADLRDLGERAVAAAATAPSAPGGARRVAEETSAGDPHEAGGEDAGRPAAAGPRQARPDEVLADGSSRGGGGAVRASSSPGARPSSAEAPPAAAADDALGEVPPAASPYADFEPGPLPLPPLPPPPRVARARPPSKVSLPPLPAPPRVAGTRPPSKVSLPPLPVPPARLARGALGTRPQGEPASSSPPGARGGAAVAPDPGSPGGPPRAARGPARRRERPPTQEPLSGGGAASPNAAVGVQAPGPVTRRPAKRRAGAPVRARGSKPHGAASRGGTRLVTPAGAERFYDQTFRELEVLERDLLERGPWPQAMERLEALTAEAQALAQALGPSARSGDREFAAALTKVERVQGYLDRVRPLAQVSPEPQDPEEEPLDESGMLGKLGRLWRRGRDKRP